MGSRPHSASLPGPRRARVLLLAFALAAVPLAPAFAAHGPDSLADEAAAVSDAVVNISATQVEEKQAKNDSADAPDL